MQWHKGQHIVAARVNQCAIMLGDNLFHRTGEGIQGQREPTMSLLSITILYLRVNYLTHAITIRLENGIIWRGTRGTMPGIPCPQAVINIPEKLVEFLKC